MSRKAGAPSQRALRDAAKLTPFANPAVLTSPDLHARAHCPLSFATICVLRPISQCSLGPWCCGTRNRMIWPGSGLCLHLYYALRFRFSKQSFELFVCRRRRLRGSTLAHGPKTSSFVTIPPTPATGPMRSPWCSSSTATSGSRVSVVSSASVNRRAMNGMSNGFARVGARLIASGSHCALREISSRDKERTVQGTRYTAARRARNRCVRRRVPGGRRRRAGADVRLPRCRWDRAPFLR